MKDFNNFYNGNPKLKSVGTQVEFTNEQITEFVKCAKDPVYFIENYVKIVSLDEGLVLMKLFPYQKRILEAVHENRFTIAMLFRQGGKMLPLDTLIPTPSGFRKLVDIHEGDIVYGDDGKETKVIAENEPHYEKMYEITFDTGEKITACRHHQWTVKNRFKTSCGEHVEQTLTTEEMFNSRWRQPARKDRNDIWSWAYYIPNTRPVEYPQREHLIDPYILGAWLGDGTSSCNSFTFMGKNTAFYESHNIRIHLTEKAKLRALKSPSKDTYSGRILGLQMKDLRSYNVLNNKHVPEEYLFSSVKDRLHLLQGLMDTDGYVSKQGICELCFSNKYQNLINTTETLIQSLGIKVVRSSRSAVNATSLRFKVNSDTFDEPVVTMPYKLERLHKKRESFFDDYTTSRAIVDIKPLEEEMMGKCIMVDNPRHMYLCTTGYIPTHNSSVLAAYILWFCCFNEFKTACILSNKQKSAKEIFGRVQTMYEELPSWIKPGVTEYNKTSIEFENGSKAFCDASSASAIRGRSCVSGDTVVEVEIDGKIYKDTILNLKKELDILVV